MVEKLSIRIVNKMEEEGIISLEKREYCLYALITILEKWITIISILCIALFYKRVMPMVLFLIFFLNLREKTGGFHTRSFGKCYCSTLAISVGIIYVCQISIYKMYIIYLCLICATIVIMQIGTVDHPNLGMDIKELEEAKRASRCFLKYECTIIMVVIILKVNDLYICYMSMGIILCALLLCIAKILKQDIYDCEYDQKDNEALDGCNHAGVV